MTVSRRKQTGTRGVRSKLHREADRFGLLFGGMEQNDEAAVGMLTADDGRAGGHGEPAALGTDGYGAVVGDLEAGAHAPDVGPPGTLGFGAQYRTALLLGLLPSGQGRHAQCAVFSWALW